jgi:hypothetical protein
MADVSEIELVPPGAVECAFAWCEAVLACQFDAMWSLTDGNMRLCEAQLWIHANREHSDLAGEDPDQLAGELSQLTSTHPLREYFEIGRVQSNLEVVPTFPRDDWAVASHRRIVGEDLDIVLILDGSKMPPIIESMTLLDRTTAAAMLVRFTVDGWRIAGYDYNPPVPGWPPQWGGYTEP